MLSRDGVTEVAEAAPSIKPNAWSTAFTPFLFVEKSAVSLAASFPMAVIEECFSIRVRRGILVLVLAFALALAFALLLAVALLLAIALALADRTDVHGCRACQRVTGRHDASELHAIEQDFPAPTCGSPPRIHPASPAHRL